MSTVDALYNHQQKLMQLGLLFVISFIPDFNKIINLNLQK